MNPRIRIFDTTLRDGEQTPGVHFSAEDKEAIAQALEAFGVDTIEAGFPASSPGDFEAVRRVAAVVRHAGVAALARCRPADVAAAVEALRDAAHPVPHLVMSVSDVHLKHKVRMSRARAVRAIHESVMEAKRHMEEIEVSLEDATRADPVYVRQCAQVAVEAGATRINIADTVGAALPDEFAALIAGVVAFLPPSVLVSAHCHNDMGLATANTVAAVQAGADQVEVTVNGIGERAGNAAVEEVGIVLAAKGIAATGLDMTRVQKVSALVAERSGIAVQANHPVVGANAFAHSSGIHQDGILKHAANYAWITPEMVGAKGHRMVLTARSGRKAVFHVARAMGMPVAPETGEALYSAFLRHADRADGPVTPEALAGIIHRLAPKPARQTMHP